MTKKINDKRSFFTKIKDAIKGYNNVYNQEMNSLLKKIDILDDEISNKYKLLQNCLQKIDQQNFKINELSNKIEQEQKAINDLYEEKCSLETISKSYEKIFGELPNHPAGKQTIIDPTDPDANIFELLIEKNGGNGYNNEQIQAIRYDMSKHLRIIAGAGSGKTQTICAKAAYLALSRKAKEKEIVMCTFSKRAAIEMGERIANILGENEIRTCTFHSWFRNEYIELVNKYKHLGIREMPSKIDDIQYNYLLYELIKKYNLNNFDKEGDKRINERISYWTNMCFSKDDMISFVKKHYECSINDDSTLSEIFSSFLNDLEVKKLEKKIAIFDDYLQNFYRVLNNEPEILEYIQNKYKYIFIDEFQDINPIQMNIINLICPPDKNDNNCKTKLIIVGDDDQSIYYFRGAEPKYIKKFDVEYDTYSVELMTNYRSRENIVQAGNCIIRHNRDRIAKAMISNSNVKGECYIKRLDNEEAEGKWIIDKAIKVGIDDSQDKTTPNYRNSVVLCPGEQQIQSMVNILIQNKIPYVVDSKENLGIFSITKFKRIYDNWESYVKCGEKQNAYYYKRVLENLCASCFLTKDYYSPLIDKYILDLDNIAMFINEKQKGVDILSIKNYLIQIDAMKKGNKVDFSLFVNIFCSLPVIDNKLSNEEKDWIKIELSQCNYWIDLEKKYTDAKMESNDMKNKLKAYANREYNALCIMTIHQSKGLGIDNVFVKGVYEDALPNHRAIEYNELEFQTAIEKAEPATSIEEQRRLAYVAITRAKKNLYITYPKYLGKHISLVSRFIKESNIPIYK